MKTLAAVLEETGKPLVLDELEVPELKPGQVLVDVHYSGVCHTQVLEARGYRGKDRFLPHCLGHEGSGRVAAVGPGVEKVRPGDAAILSWIQGEGANVPGSVYTRGRGKVNAGAITTFMTRAVISENRLTVLPEGVPLDAAALLGCALPTGLGAVINTARPEPGQSMAIFGVGGVGQCAVAGARVAGCAPIIAVDVVPSKLELALTMGATHTVDANTVDANPVDPVAAIAEICPGGVDFAIEVSGRPSVMAQALRSVRPRGGTAVVIGNARFGEKLELDPTELNLGKRLLGTWGGDSKPDRDYEGYARLLAEGRLDVSSLMSGPYPLEEVNTALSDLEKGTVARPILDLRPV